MISATILLSKSRLHITRLLLPILRLISFLGKPEPLCDDKDCKAIESFAKPGCVLLSKENYRLSNILIKGFWSHAAIVIDNGLVLEAVPPKVRIVSIARFVLSKDHVCLLAPKFDIDYADHSAFYLNDGYDFEFLSGNENWFCSELVFDYLSKIAKQMPMVPVISWGVPTIVPDDYFNAEDKFDRLYLNKH